MTFFTLSSDRSCDVPLTKDLTSCDLSKKNINMSNDHLMVPSASSRNLLNGNASFEEKVMFLAGKKRPHEPIEGDLSNKVIDGKKLLTDDSHMQMEAPLSKKQAMDSGKSQNVNNHDPKGEQLPNRQTPEPEASLVTSRQTTPINASLSTSRNPNNLSFKEGRDSRTVGLDSSKPEENRTISGSGATPFVQSHRVETTPLRSSSLPPSLTVNQRHTPRNSFSPSSSSSAQEKARSLTPPSQIIPGTTTTTTNQLLDTIKLVKSVSATSPASLPGNTGTSQLPAATENSVICLWKNCLK